MRRNLSLVLTLALAAFAPSPVSVCALLADLPGDCAPTASRTECDRMGAAESQAEIGAPSDQSCCQVSQAPLPSASGKVTPPDSNTLAPRAGESAVAALMSTEWHRPASLPDFSPPEQQSLLCVFLI